MTTRQPTHRVVAEAALLLSRTADGQYLLDDRAANALRDSLHTLSDRSDVKAAVQSLVDLAAHIKGAGSSAGTVQSVLKIAQEAAARL